MEDDKNFNFYILLGGNFSLRNWYVFITYHVSSKDKTSKLPQCAPNFGSSDKKNVQ